MTEKTVKKAAPKRAVNKKQDSEHVLVVWVSNNSDEPSIMYSRDLGITTDQLTLPAPHSTFTGIGDLLHKEMNEGKGRILYSTVYEKWIDSSDIKYVNEHFYYNHDGKFVNIDTSKMFTLEGILWLNNIVEEGVPSVVIFKTGKKGKLANILYKNISKTYADNLIPIINGNVNVSNNQKQLKDAGFDYHPFGRGFSRNTFEPKDDPFAGSPVQTGPGAYLQEPMTLGSGFRTAAENALRAKSVQLSPGCNCDVCRFNRGENLGHVPFSVHQNRQAAQPTFDDFVKILENTFPDMPAFKKNK